MNDAGFMIIGSSAKLPGTTIWSTDDSNTNVQRPPPPCPPLLTDLCKTSDPSMRELSLWNDAAEEPRRVSNQAKGDHGQKTTWKVNSPLILVEKWIHRCSEPSTRQWVIRPLGESHYGRNKAEKRLSSREQCNSHRLRKDGLQLSSCERLVFIL